MSSISTFSNIQRRVITPVDSVGDGKSDDTTQENITPIWNKTFCTVMTLSPQGASENGSDTL